MGFISMNLILIVASTGPLVGGMENQLALQAQYLAKLPDIDVTIIASPTYKALFDPSLTFIPIEMKRSRRNPTLLLELIKNVHRVNPDIIHAHGHKAVSLLGNLRLFIKRKIHLVGTAHGQKRKNKAFKKMAKVLSVSKSIQQTLSPITSTVVYNGIEPGVTPSDQAKHKAEFCSSLGLDSKRPLILGVGRLVKLKNFDRLINASKNLDANLVILGDGPEHQTLQDLSSGNVVLAGFREDTRSILYLADLMVICSDREGFSLVLIEALQSQLPVLSTRVGVAVELLPNEHLIDSTEETALSKTIQDHLSDLPTLRAKQKELFIRAERDFNIEKITAHTRDIYQTLMPNKSV